MNFHIHSMISQKVNAFSENLIRTKFILHKIFLVDVLRFTLKNDASKLSAYNNYCYCHDIGHSFAPIFMKFTWLVRVRMWVNPILFWKQLVQ